MGHGDTEISLEYVCRTVKHNVGYMSLGSRGRSFTEHAHFEAIAIEINAEDRMRSPK